jgi:hypothetical protein
MTLVLFFALGWRRVANGQGELDASGGELRPYTFEKWQPVMRQPALDNQ